MKIKKLFLCITFLFLFNSTIQAETSNNIPEIAQKCHSEIVEVLNGLIEKNKLSMAQLFDTFYIPIKGTNPKKFNTQYDKYTDLLVRPIIDKYLSDKIVYIIAVDVNGYAPTHNKRYSLNKAGMGALDVELNRTKRIFNDKTGLAAARNTKPFLKQSYQRDTGETIYDYSIPIFIKKKHWGALRIGYRE